MVCSDAGSENLLIHALQMFLRRNHTDRFAGPASVMIVTSPKNQRAESMNRLVRERVLDQFIDMFDELIDTGYLVTTNSSDMALLRLIFDDLVRTAMQDHVTEWNTHPIRKQSLTHSPSGVPDALFSNPER
jgi:hypothetical protein